MFRLLDKKGKANYYFLTVTIALGIRNGQITQKCFVHFNVIVEVRVHHTSLYILRYLHWNLS